MCFDMLTIAGIVTNLAIPAVVIYLLAVKPSKS